jgi:asparagine synthase (glutamine-hydrolysing)
MVNLSGKTFKGKHFLGCLNLSEYQTYRERIGFFSDTELRRLIRYMVDYETTVDLQHYYNTAGSTVLERMSRTDFSFYLPDDILTKVDRASMAVSLEARVPILDHLVCEFAFSLDDQFKFRRGIKKYILKKLAFKLLPVDVLLERKQGFSVPLSEWMNGALGGRLNDLLSGNDLSAHLNKKMVRGMLCEHKSGKRDHGQKLWSILIFGKWLEQNFYRSS